LLRRTSVLLQFQLQWDHTKNWATVSCLSYVPLYRRLTDVGFVEAVLAAENMTTYEIHVAPVSASEQPREHAFVAEHFGPLRDYASGGGTYDGSAWQDESSIQDSEFSCYPLCDAPVTTVDGGLYPSVAHQNDDGSAQAVASGYCRKCLPADNPEGCRWCEYEAYSYCTGPSNTKITLGFSLPWDECLDLVAENTNCSHFAYAGGDIGRCTCMRIGENCNIARSEQSQTVYIRQCGSVPAM